MWMLFEGGPIYLPDRICRPGHTRSNTTDRPTSRHSRKAPSQMQMQTQTAVNCSYSFKRAIT